MIRFIPKGKRRRTNTRGRSSVQESTALPRFVWAEGRVWGLDETRTPMYIEDV